MIFIIVMQIISGIKLVPICYNKLVLLSLVRGVKVECFVSKHIMAIICWMWSDGIMAFNAILKQFWSVTNLNGS